MREIGPLGFSCSWDGDPGLGPGPLHQAGAVETDAGCLSAIDIRNTELRLGGLDSSLGASASGSRHWSAGTVRAVVAAYTSRLVGRGRGARLAGRPTNGT